MLTSWNNIAITKIWGSEYISSGEQGPYPRFRLRQHTFLLNDATGERILHFSDGTTQRTGPYEIRYLPKGAEYWVERIHPGACWLIMFDTDADIGEPPFNWRLRNYDAALRIFKEAVKAANGVRMDTDFCETVVKKCVYELIFLLRREYLQTDAAKERQSLLDPALSKIHLQLGKQGDLSIKELAALCGISERYFRTLFQARFNKSPKEYILQMRMNYAKELLYDSQYSVTEIALMCGYAELHHFTREFSKRVGISPKAFRTMIRVE